MNILAIGAHPDDIEFGCGGALINLAKGGHNAYLLVMTKGEVGGSSAVRKREQDKAAAYMGARKVFFGEFSDTCVPTDKKLITAVENVITKVDPDLVFLNYYNDIHQDHRAIANGGLSATRYVKNVLFYEVPTTREFEPDIFFDIGNVLEEKMALLKIHSSQVHKTKVPRLTILESAQSCAIFRGYQGRVKFAEGFKSLRYLISL